MTDGHIRIEQIRIENVFGVRELEFDPDGVSVIRGDNDTGKTSVLRAINLLLTGGQDAEALHKDAESGRVEFELSDGTRVWASLTEKKIYYRIDGRTDVTARQLLEFLQDEVSVNPVSILRARPRDRGQMLLEALPMTVDNERLSSALSPLDGDWPSFPYGVEDFEKVHALEVLGDTSSGFIGTLYQKRQELHGAKRNKEGAVEDLKQSVSEHEDPEILKRERAEARQQASEAREQMQQELSSAEAAKDEAIQEANRKEQEEIEKIRAKYNEKRETIQSRHSQQEEEIRSEYEPTISQAEKRAERLDEKVEQAVKEAQTKETLEERKGELQELEDRYQSLSRAIDNLRSLRTDFQDDLPSNVTIADDGEILNDEGIRFENWNEQSQVQFAMRIAEMRMGELPLIPLDGIEKVVGKQRETLIRFCKDSPAQFILTEAVPGEPLTVEHV